MPHLPDACPGSPARLQTRVYSPGAISDPDLSVPAARRIRYDYKTRTAGFSQQRFDEWWNEMDKDDDQQITKEEMVVMMDRLCVIIATHSTHTLSCWSTLLFSVRL